MLSLQTKTKGMRGGIAFDVEGDDESEDAEDDAEAENIEDMLRISEI